MSKKNLIVSKPKNDSFNIFSLATSLIKKARLHRRLQEFERKIWDHTKDPFQISFDEPSKLNERIVEAMTRLSHILAKETDETILIKQIRQDIKEIGITYFEKLLQFSGLTRSKILTDLRSIAAAGSIKVKIPSSYARLPYSNAWEFAGRYLLRRIKPVLSAVIDVRNPAKVLGAINYATWSGWIRQERAKRSGHEAEGRLARVFKEIGIPFVPIGKADNPLSGDIQLYGVSFDLIVPNTSNPRLCVKATVHTAAIGQYGESKDHLEVYEAKRMLDEKFAKDDRPVLLAFADGIGFRSNRAGLEGVLTKADEFCQFRTIWKAVVIAESKLGGIPDLKLFLPISIFKEFEEFLGRYNWDRSRLLSKPPSTNAVVAGEGIFEVGTPPSKPKSILNYLSKE